LNSASQTSGKPLYERLGGHAGILKLIRPFYADVRQHALLGPIFNAHIKDWDAHLTKITDFWALQAGGKSNYPGGFAGAHMGLGLQPEHFQNWIALWEYNNARSLPAQEAAELNALAHELGRRLFAMTQGRNPHAGLRGFQFSPPKPPAN
jgi:hemoglobin